MKKSPHRLKNISTVVTLAFLLLSDQGCFDYRDKSDTTSTPIPLVTVVPSETPVFDESNYYPCDIGSKWTYDLDSEKQRKTLSQTLTIEGLETVYGELCYVVIEKGPGKTKKSYLQEREDGIYMLAQKGSFFNIRAKLDPPLKVLHLPLKVGEIWSSFSTAKAVMISKRAGVKGEVLAEERITIPAGTFNSFKIHIRKTKGKKVETRFMWYTPGIGIIKQSGGKYEKELRKYEKPVGAETDE